MFSSKALRLSSASFFLLAFSLGCHAATLAPHRAYYDLEVKRLDSASGIATIKGKLAYEITGSSCEGYAVTYRIANRIGYSEGGAQVIDTQLASWESGDGLQMDVTQKQFLDSRLSSENRVKVIKKAAGTPGQAEIVLPKPKQFETDASAIFPTAFQMRLLDAATKGSTRDDSLVFEGSDEDQSMRVISFIGPRQAAGSFTAEASSSDLASLGKVPSWPVSISYYNAKSTGDEQPVYQASFKMLENGISTDLVLDYGTYALSGKLSKIELLKAEPCN
ncbi:MAG: cell envelope integrity EipB family protein [Proteobacteria bacterium]|nr:cell envelope integrity EipB family protein [Pseudomonadota bacterium]